MAKGNLFNVISSQRSPIAHHKRSKALLIFSANDQKDFTVRGLSKRFSEFLKIPTISSKVGSQADVHLFTVKENLCSLKNIPSVCVHAQIGHSFGERFQNAIEKLRNDGYQQIVVIGSDCPELASNDIDIAFNQLSHHTLVLGPDHRGGCYLIGFHTHDTRKFSTIQWQANTDCFELQRIFGTENTFLLSVKHDIDSMTDIRLLAKCKNRSGARARTLLLQEEKHYSAIESSCVLVPLPTDCQRARWQLPPPSTFSFFT